MSTFNRRDFLASQLAVGATITIDVPLAQASTLQVDDAWKQLLDGPWYFDVDEYGTITQAGVEETKTKGDVFDIWVAGIRNPDDVIGVVEGGCQRLAGAPRGPFARREKARPPPLESQGKRRLGIPSRTVGYIVAT